MSCLCRKLTDFFAWRCSSSGRVADQTLDRLARRLMQGEPIEKIEMYALGIARMLLKESARRVERRQTALREIRLQVQTSLEDTDVFGSIERCLAALPESSRELIERYYTGSARRWRASWAFP